MNIYIYLWFIYIKKVQLRKKVQRLTKNKWIHVILDVLNPVANIAIAQAIDKASARFQWFVEVIKTFYETVQE